jgi:hypothetical protein
MLCRIAEVLLEREVLDGLEFQKLVDGEELPPKEDIKTEADVVVEEPELSQQKSYEEIETEITDDASQDDATKDGESFNGVF